MPGYGFEWLSYLYAGLGVWSQLWGMWLLPIALGLTWRAVDRNEYVVPAAIAQLSASSVGNSAPIVRALGLRRGRAVFARAISIL